MSRMLQASRRQIERFRNPVLVLMGLVPVEEKLPMKVKREEIFDDM
jgi:hypothetical protein